MVYIKRFSQKNQITKSSVQSLRYKLETQCLNDLFTMQRESMKL